MSDKTEIPFEETTYGFRFGDAIVKRLISLPSGAVTIGIKTSKNELDVHVTKAGKIRLWLNGMELPLK